MALRVRYKVVQLLLAAGKVLWCALSREAAVPGRGDPCLFDSIRSGLGSWCMWAAACDYHWNLKGSSVIAVSPLGRTGCWGMAWLAGKVGGACQEVYQIFVYYYCSTLWIRLAYDLSIYKRIQMYLPAERSLFQLKKCVCTEREKRLRELMTWWWLFVICITVTFKLRLNLLCVQCCTKADCKSGFPRELNGEQIKDRRKMTFPRSEKEREELPCLGLCSYSMAEFRCEFKYISATPFTQIDVASWFLSSIALTA